MPIVVSSTVHKRNEIEFVRVNELKKLSIGFVKMSTLIFFHNRQNCQTVESLYIEDGSFHFNSLSSRYPV